MWLNVKVKRVVKDMRKIFFTFKNISQRAVFDAELYLGFQSIHQYIVNRAALTNWKCFVVILKTRSVHIKKNILRTNTFSCYLPNCAKCVTLFK